MKLKNVTYAGALLATLALSACSNDLDKNSEWGNKDVRFTAAIASQTSRVTNGGNAWEDGDQIGIYMTKAGETVDKAIAGNQLYKAAVNGTLSATGTALQYPDEGNVDFTAYYPYTSTTDGNVAVDVSDQTKPIDLLYAKSANIAKSSDAVKLSFSHQLSYIVLNVSSSDGSAISGLKVALTGTKTAGSFNLNDKNLTVTDTSVKDITFNTKTDGTISAGIALPTTSLTDAKLEFALGDKKVEKALPVTALNAGSQYTIPVDLKGGMPGEDLSINFGNATITDWTTGVVSGNVDVDFGEGGEVTPPTTEGNGTKASPYNVAQAIAKQDGSKAWVTGYIVGYVVNGADIKAGSKFDLNDKDNISVSNLLLAASADVKDYTACIPIQLVSGSAVRNAINLKDNATMLGKSITIYGQLTKYFSVSGLKSPSAVLVDGKLIGTDPGEGGETPTPTTTPGTLTKVADLTDGTYAIGTVKDGTYQLMTNVLKGYYGTATAWTSGVIPSDCLFTVKKSGNGWLIQGADDKYVYIEKNETYYNLKFDGTDAITVWTLTAEGDAVKAIYGDMATNWIAYSTQYGTYQAAYSGTQNAVLINFYKQK